MEIKDRELHRVVVTAIVYKDGKYLITKRSSNKKVFPNKWHVPGGGLEIDDYINLPTTNRDNEWYYVVENALRREIREEVNLEIGKPNYLLDLAFISPVGQPVIVFSYYAEYKSGEIKLSDDDNVDYRWVGIEELKDYDLIDGIEEEIEMVDKILKNNGNTLHTTR
ncbi:MAG: NUDIX domain-containing protein [Candidatus Paceibacterota bacterium]|jgi:8-oxo-dGTP pyrophosphatase MutT (NUDIX family)